MAPSILYFGAQLGKGLRMRFRNEQRVVSKSLVTRQRLSNLAEYFPLKMGISRRKTNGSDAAMKMSRPVLRPFQFSQ
jgi:hypothetical protein